MSRIFEERAGAYVAFKWWHYAVTMALVFLIGVQGFILVNSIFPVSILIVLSVLRVFLKREDGFDDPGFTRWVLFPSLVFWASGWAALLLSKLGIFLPFKLVCTSATILFCVCSGRAVLRRKSIFIPLCVLGVLLALAFWRAAWMNVEDTWNVIQSGAEVSGAMALAGRLGNTVEIMNDVFFAMLLVRLPRRNRQEPENSVGDDARKVS